jgi:hypothetical protein
LAWYAQRQQAIAESRQFAAQARQKFDVDPAASLLLAIRAVHRFRTEQAEVELNAALGVSQIRIILHHSGPVFAAAFSPDGTRVVTASQDQTARVYIVDLGDLVTWPEHQLPIETK